MANKPRYRIVNIGKLGTGSISNWEYVFAVEKEVPVFFGIFGLTKWKRLQDRVAMPKCDAYPEEKLKKAEDLILKDSIGLSSNIVGYYEPDVEGIRKLTDHARH